MKVPMQFLEATLASDPNAKGDKYRKQIIWYTGATVNRVSWEDGEYKLTLGMKPENVRMERFASGKAPVLNGHASYSVSDVIGVIERGWIEKGKGLADIRFSEREDVRPIVEDVNAGILRNASVGAKIWKLKDVTGEEEKIKSYIAVDWEPYELSLLPIGADKDAGFSGAVEVRFSEAEIVSDSIQGAITARIEVTRMKKDETNAGQDTRKEEVAASAASDSASSVQLSMSIVNRERVEEEATQRERLRAAEIRGITKALELSDDLADQHMKLGTKTDAFRAIAIDKKAALAAQEPETRTHVSSIIADEADTRRAAMSLALLNRTDPKKYQIDETARQYANLSLLEMAKECLQAKSISYRGLDRMTVAKLAFESTSDYPYILANALNKNLRAGYEIADALSQWKLIAARRTAPDFKSMSELQLDGKTRLALLPESGEYQHGAMVEGHESWYLKTYGQILAITRQVIVNDDLAAFTRIPMLLGQEVAVLEATTVWGIITANGTLSDGVALFYATTHTNLDGSSAAISVTSLGTGIAGMMKQTTPGGKTMNIAPRYLVHPVALITVARQYTSPIYSPAAPGQVPGFLPNQASYVNPFAGTLTPIAEARLDTASSTAWYLFADPQIAPVLVYCYLEGQEGPYTETRQGFDVDGIEVKIRHDFAAAAIDWRGAWKNAGA